MRFQEHLHQQFIDRLFPERDLLVAILDPGAQFHPVQRALARQRLFQFLPARQNAEDRILPQLLVIVEVFVAQRQAVDPLRQHLPNRMLHLLLIPAIQKALRQPRQQIQTLDRSGAAGTRRHRN